MFNQNNIDNENNDNIIYGKTAAEWEEILDPKVDDINSMFDDILAKDKESLLNEINDIDDILKMLYDEGEYLTYCVI